MVLGIDTKYVELARIAEVRNLEHWVCFACHKMFKRPATPENVASGPLRPARPYICPQCGRSMLDMGIYFEPPRRRDTAGWARMKLIAEFGLGYYTEGSRKYIDRELVGSPPVSPRNLRRQLVQLQKCWASLSLRRNARYLKEVRRQKAAIRRRDR